MDALAALKTRRSIRAYRDTPVARETIADIIDCGRLAASAVNVQPWEFVVVTAADMRQRLAALTDHGKHIAEAPVCVAVLCQDTKYYLEDGAAATQNLLVAAHANGLGSCWVAGDKKAYAADVTRLLGAPVEMRLVSLITIGYSAEEPAPAKRSVSEVLHWDRF
jgi:nitroreductase